MLSALVGSLVTSTSLSDVLLVACSLLSFPAVLRYDDISKLRCCDVTFSIDSMLYKYFIAKPTKTVKETQFSWPEQALLDDRWKCWSNNILSCWVGSLGCPTAHCCLC